MLFDSTDVCLIETLPFCEGSAVLLAPQHASPSHAGWCFIHPAQRPSVQYLYMGSHLFCCRAFPSDATVVNRQCNQQFVIVWPNTLTEHSRGRVTTLRGLECNTPSRIVRAWLY